MFIEDGLSQAESSPIDFRLCVRDGAATRRAICPYCTRCPLGVRYMANSESYRMVLHRQTTPPSRPAPSPVQQHPPTFTPGHCSADRRR
ncbi:hypothetical protein BaRGS_00019032 [Batillaria attramentaria]|uniref:Uncharacterized protein n=1 Tax=Batillaria attramentaria TaxID=370345 RepID=A0ABD0KR16_9CAEN